MLVSHLEEVESLYCMIELMTAQELFDLVVMNDIELLNQSSL
jgi:hypothetical protein